MFLVIYVPKTQSVEVRQLGSSNRVPGEWHEDLEVGSDSAGRSSAAVLVLRGVERDA